MSKVLHIASDHAGYELKTILAEQLRKEAYNLTDHGTNSLQSCDYPLFAQALCTAVLTSGAPGILICGTGIGMSMAANRFGGIRAALCNNEFTARACRLHNNANVLCLGSRVVGSGLAASIVAAFLESPFEGGRHEKRLTMFPTGI